MDLKGDFSTFLNCYSEKYKNFCPEYDSHASSPSLQRALQHKEQNAEWQAALNLAKRGAAVFPQDISTK